MVATSKDFNVFSVKVTVAGQNYRTRLVTVYSVYQHRKNSDIDKF